MSRAQAIERFRRGCTNREVRDVVVEALKGGARFKLTRKGIRILGPRGTAAAHYTGSDARAGRNLRSDLRRIGVL